MWHAKKSAPIVFDVSSQPVAFAPFSQNSKMWGSRGFDHAQLTQAKPPGLFCFVSAAADFSGARSWIRARVTDFADPQPPAGPS